MQFCILAPTGGLIASLTFSKFPTSRLHWLGKQTSATRDPITSGLGGFPFSNDTCHHLAIVKAGRVDVTSNSNKVPFFLRKTPCLCDDDQGCTKHFSVRSFSSFLILPPPPNISIHTSRVHCTRTNMKTTHSSAIRFPAFKCGRGRSSWHSKL